MCKKENEIILPLKPEVHLLIITCVAKVSSGIQYTNLCHSCFLLVSKNF